MIGQLNPSYREVTIIGAGIAGLILAESLDRAGWQVTLVEATERVGGLINTSRTDFGQVESAAHSLQVTPAVRALFARLSVELVPVRNESRARYIWRKGTLRRMPLSVVEFLRLLGRAYFVLADPGTDPAHLTLEQWAQRHLGDPACKYLITPFVRGIYGARPSEIEVGMAFPALIVPRGHSLLSWMLRRWHLRLRGKGEPKRPRMTMMAPRLGMGALVQALEGHLRKRLGDRFKTELPATALPHAKNIVLCVPASAAAQLLSAEDPALARSLRAVVYTPLIAATAFAEKRAFGTPPSGVGVLLPEGTQRKCLGVLFNSSSFPNRVRDERNWVSLTLMMGGSARPDIVYATDEALHGAARADLEALFDLAPGSHLDIFIHRWVQAVPQYNQALRAAWETAREGWCAKPGHVLFGNYTGQVSVRGMIETVSQLIA